MTEIFSYRNKNTFLHRLNPIIKLLLMLSIAFIPWYFSLPVLVLSAIIIKLPFIKYLKNLIFFFILAILIYFSNGWQSSMRFITIVLSGLILTDTTEPMDLAKSLQPVLGRTFALLVQLTLAMLPIVFETCETVRLTRKSRGEKFISLSYLEMILSVLLDKSDEITLAYKTRNVH
ncbi:MAG: energy-coupling factor transporter transmembrane component T [Sphaerochaetaceae bacterium]|nr:energy-coupling factor transporter transmembrane component T [Sphaerochaetaceae bacterium]